MTTPIRPESPHPAEYLQYLRETKPDEAKLYEQYLTETGQQAHIATAGRQAEYRSGRLGRRMGRENTNEREALELAQEQDRNPGGLRGMAQRIPSALTAASKDIPGAEAAQAAFRSGVSLLNPLQEDQSYTEALGDVREGYEGLNKGARIPLRVVGGGIGAAALPIKSPATAGAVYGGLTNLLDADPETTGQRALNTGIGFGVGGVAGKVADVATTGIRALTAKPLGTALGDLQTARSAASAPLYDAALAQGAGRTGTPEVQAFVARPDVAEIVSGLQSSVDEFAQMAPDDPRMLDAIYKVLSDRQGVAKRGLEAVNPSKPNLGRYTEQQIRTVKRQGLRAMSDGLNAPMPAYRPAVQEFAEGSRAVNALKRGNNTMAIESGGGASVDNLQRNSREALMEFLEQPGRDVRAEAVQGVLGLGQRKLEQSGATGLVNPMRGMSRNFLLKGGDLLRAVEGTAGQNASKPLTQTTLLDFLRRAGVAGATPEGF